MNIQELLDKGLIRKSNPSETEIKGALLSSDNFIEKAIGNFKMEYHDIAFLCAYNSMFQTGKALLLKAGYKERGHYALIQTLKICYKNEKRLEEFLDVMDSYRQSRHAVQYDGETASEIDSKEAINDARRFIEIAKTILK